MSTPASPPKTRHLRKGELLFAEGEGSKSMYFLKSGMIRIFKKKGDSPIEIETVRSGQILGELAFLDGNPRSASAEALTECDLMEISGQSFQEVMGHMPDWLKILLKTVVQRLRTASTRIRQLDTVSTALDYSDRDGKRTSHYVYLTAIEVMKVCTAVLLVASRNGTKTAAGLEFKPSLLTRYANQVMGVPAAKISTLTDVFAQAQITINPPETADAVETKITLKDPDFLERLVSYLNDENLAEFDKRHDLSPKGFLIMSLVMKHLAKYPRDAATGIATVNLAEIRKSETPEGGKEPFTLSDIEELVRLEYAGPVKLNSSTDVLTAIAVDAFVFAYRVQKFNLCIHAANEQKNKSAGARAA
jgi:CRP-like cAMP-binding protein